MRQTLVGVATGVAIAIAWPAPVIDMPIVRELAFEPPPVDTTPVAPGHRGVILGVDGLPASGVEVFLTELDHKPVLLHHAIATNYAGQFALPARPGRYRIQAQRGFNHRIDREIVIPAAGHPDLELRLVEVPLLHYLVHRDRRD